MASFELAQALLIDARAVPPAHALTLTTADPDLPPAVYRAGSLQLWRRLRRRFGPQVQYGASIEFTTGKRAADGRRRMHGHHLVKGLDGCDVVEVESLVRETWEATTGAFVVEVAELVTPGAALAYLGLHHRKPEQAPPEGWRGMRWRASQGYWHRPVAELRAQARAEQLERRRVAWWIAEGLGAEDARELALLEIEAQREPGAWQLVRVDEPSTPGGVVRPAVR